VPCLTALAPSGLHVVKDFGLGDTPSTKTAAALIKATAPGPNVLVVIGRADEVGQKSVRNLPGIHALHPDQLNTYDVLELRRHCLHEGRSRAVRERTRSRQRRPPSEHRRTGPQ
jgi:ribosomal protein L4